MEKETQRDVCVLGGGGRVGVNIHSSPNHTHGTQGVPEVPPERGVSLMESKILSTSPSGGLHL